MWSHAYFFEELFAAYCLALGNSVLILFYNRHIFLQITKVMVIGQDIDFFFFFFFFFFLTSFIRFARKCCHY